LDPIPEELANLISQHEIEVLCSECKQSVSKSLGFIKAHRTMQCPACSGLILLDVSVIRAEARQVEKSLIELHAQLSTRLGDGGEKGS
jgi:DNA-directed RNA polymerase subunit RPC12/RpoP